MRRSASLARIRLDQVLNGPVVWLIHHVHLIMILANGVGPCRLDVGEDSHEFGIAHDPLELRHQLRVDGNAIGHCNAVADEPEQGVVGMLPVMTAFVMKRRSFPGDAYRRRGPEAMRPLASPLSRASSPCRD